MSAYWIINLLSVSLPLVFSFHPRFAFYKKWKFWIPALGITAFVFLVWDAWFTGSEVWWFNEKYIADVKVWGMPLEEWAFFFCIPYACIFTYEVFKNTLPKFRLSLSIVNAIVVALSLFWLVALLFYPGHLYTQVCFGFSLLLVGLTRYQYPDLLQSFLPVFLILLIPFVLVNGFLTGSFSAMEIVGYNDNFNMGLRFLRIPIEDFSYALSMILMSLVLIRFFEESFETKNAR